jgi:hypothetical protein
MDHLSDSCAEPKIQSFYNVQPSSSFGLQQKYPHWNLIDFTTRALAIVQQYVSVS